MFGPAGCTISYSYATPSNSLITSRTDANSHTYSYSYSGTSQLVSVTDAESPSHTITYAYNTVNEYTSDFYNTTQSFARTVVTLTGFSPRHRVGNTGLTLPGNLWRVIDPLNHITRQYFNNNSQMLYQSIGYRLQYSAGSGVLRRTARQHQ